MDTKRILIACSMMEDEIKAAMAQTGVEIPVVWMRRALHNSPKDMTGVIQGEIDKLQDYDEILLAYGLCGRGTEGLVSARTRLVIPRFDDCINILLCSGKREKRALAEKGCIYLTRGWTIDGEGIAGQCRRLKREYDSSMYETIIDSIYGGYHSLSVIDTGCYDTGPVIEYAREAAELINAGVKMTDGSARILKGLLSGDRDENYIVLEPGERLEHSFFQVPGEGTHFN